MFHLPWNQLHLIRSFIAIPSLNPSQSALHPLPPSFYRRARFSHPLPARVQPRAARRNTSRRNGGKSASDAGSSSRNKGPRTLEVPERLASTLRANEMTPPASGGTQRTRFGEALLPTFDVTDVIFWDAQPHNLALSRQQPASVHKSRCLGASRSDCSTGL